MKWSSGVIICPSGSVVSADGSVSTLPTGQTLPHVRQFLSVWSTHGRAHWIKQSMSLSFRFLKPQQKHMILDQKIINGLWTLKLSFYISPCPVLNSVWLVKALFTPYQTCSTNHNLNLSGSMLSSVLEDYPHMNIHHCIQPGTHSHSHVSWRNMGWTDLPKDFT